MLAKTKYAAGDIVSFKMVNGDEIVAKIVSTTVATFTVHKPTTVMPSERGIGLVQSLFTGALSENVEISKSHVMFDSPTVIEIKNHYIETTSGLALPTQ